MAVFVVHHEYQRYDDRDETKLVGVYSTEAKAKSAANALGIPRVYGSYEALLADPDIEAIYNPLPNHMHVPWSVKCAAAMVKWCQKLDGSLGLSRSVRRHISIASCDRPSSEK
jgi:predicted dehydrogenase